MLKHILTYLASVILGVLISLPTLAVALAREAGGHAMTKRDFATTLLGDGNQKGSIPLLILG